MEPTANRSFGAAYLRMSDRVRALVGHPDPRGREPGRNRTATDTAGADTSEAMVGRKTCARRLIAPQGANTATLTG